MVQHLQWKYGHPSVRRQVRSHLRKLPKRQGTARHRYGQLYWTVGKNPFGQSLIYGEGHNYPQLNSFSSGEITGEMPVGIRTLGNADIPYWPQTNNACYKEVWVTSAGKWLSLIAEY